MSLYERSPSDLEGSEPILFGSSGSEYVFIVEWEGDKVIVFQEDELSMKDYRKIQDHEAHSVEKIEVDELLERLRGE